MYFLLKSIMSVCRSKKKRFYLFGLLEYQMNYEVQITNKGL